MTNRIASTQETLQAAGEHTYKWPWRDARYVVACLGLFVATFTLIVWPSVTAALTAIAVFMGFSTLLLATAYRAGCLSQFGAANAITTLRAALSAIMAGAIVNAEMLSTTWWLSGLAAIAFILDGIDGIVARRHSLTSKFGALFDQEVDAALILILTLLLAVSGKIGIWIVGAGLMRYILLGAGWVWPIFTAPLPKSRFRSSVCGILVAALVICLLPVVDSGAVNIIGSAALFVLILSFAKDVLWLLTKAPRMKRA